MNKIIKKLLGFFRRKKVIKPIIKKHYTIQEAVADMNKRVDFTEYGHTYQVKSSGEWLQGVSTVSSIIPKEWLSAWGAKEAVKYLGYSDYPEDTERAEEMHRKIIGLDMKSYQSLLKEAKGAAFRKSKEALVDGKAGHKWLETYVKAKIDKTELPAMPEGLLLRPITQFLEWEKKNVKEWILSECLVANPEKGYAGTLDAVALFLTGRFNITDFKFATNISEDSFLQTAGYLATFEPYGIDVSNWDRTVIRLPKTLLKEEYNHKTRKYSMVENNIDPHLVKTPFELDRETFMHMLPVKKWINFILKQKERK